jgi:hypothetical protein
MLTSPMKIMELAARMQERSEKGFRISPETANLVITALHYFAAAQAPEPASFKIEQWDWKGLHVEQVVASASLIVIARTAFATAREQLPGARLTLRQGIRVIDETGPS